MVAAQRGYYNLQSARDALEARISALADAIPPGSTILDIGCNDGHISNGLIERGIVSKSYCYDLENIIAFHRKEMPFEAANLNKVDLKSFPQTDGVLLLNVLHHVIGNSHLRAREIVDYFLERYSFVIVDLGSFTETGDWGWRRRFDKHWSSDAELWAFLFENAAWKFKLLRYTSQGKGMRVLWKLYGKPYDIGPLETLQTFKRTPGAWPTDKILVDVNELDTVEKVVESVKFSICSSTRRDKFWRKKYLRSVKLAEHEYNINLAAEATLVGILHRTRKKNLPRVRVCRPLSYGPSELIFPFEPDLFTGEIVHFQDWGEFLTNEEYRIPAVLAAAPVKLEPDWPRMMFHHVCDFQVCRAWDGLVVLDFEPNHWLYNRRFPLSGE